MGDTSAGMSAAAAALSGGWCGDGTAGDDASRELRRAFFAAGGGGGGGVDASLGRFPRGSSDEDVGGGGVVILEVCALPSDSDETQVLMFCHYPFYIQLFVKKEHIVRNNSD